MNIKVAESNRFFQWTKPRWILLAYVVFAALVAIFDRLVADTENERIIVPITGGSGLDHDFGLKIAIVVMLAFSCGVGKLLLAAHLSLQAAFGLWDACDHVFGRLAGAEDYGNPYLIYSPWRPMITVVLPLFWIALLISSWFRHRRDRGHDSLSPLMSFNVWLVGLLMPSRLVIVKGKPEQKFFAMLLRQRFPNRFFSVVASENNDIEKRLDDIRRMEREENRKSPFQERLFFVFDLQNDEMRKRIVEKGICENLTYTLSKNDIEHFYPREMMKGIFHCGDAQIDEMKTDPKEIEINGMRMARSELAAAVCTQLTADTDLAPELMRLLTTIAQPKVGKHWAG